MTTGSSERKSPGRAVLYSLGGTVGGTIALIPAGGLGFLLGPVFGPSFGHYYAENPQRAKRGIYIRTGILGPTVLIAVGTLSLDPLGFGMLAVTAHAVYDIVKAWHSAQEFNEGIASTVRVAPTVGPRGKQVGLSMQIGL